MSEFEGGPLDNSNKEEYAQLRASGRTPTECATIIGVTPNTVYNYNKDSSVVQRIEELKFERRDLAGMDFGEQFRKWNELYRIAMEQNNLKIAKECLEKIDSLGGYGHHGGGDIVAGKVRGLIDKTKGGSTTNNLILFSGDDPNNTDQFTSTLNKFKDIINTQKPNGDDRGVIDVTPNDP
jgi:hypothetical protein